MTKKSPIAWSKLLLKFKDLSNLSESKRSKFWERILFLKELLIKEEKIAGNREAIKFIEKIERKLKASNDFEGCSKFLETEFKKIEKKKVFMDWDMLSYEKNNKDINEVCVDEGVSILENLDFIRSLLCDCEGLDGSVRQKTHEFANNEWMPELEKTNLKKTVPEEEKQSAERKRPFKI